MEEQILETWAIHNRIHLYLLQAIPPEALCQSPPNRARSPFQLFAHMHNVRLMWLKAAAPELMSGVAKIEGTEGTAEDIAGALEASGTAIEALLRNALAAGGKVKGFKPHAVAFMGYLISHESHHRGQMTLVLKQIGHPLDNKTDYGMWEWGVR